MIPGDDRLPSAGWRHRRGGWSSGDTQGSPSDDVVAVGDGGGMPAPGPRRHLSRRTTGPPGAYFRMFTARATTRRATTSEIAASAIISSFAHGRIADTSVGLNAVAVAKEKWK